MRSMKPPGHLCQNAKDAACFRSKRSRGPLDHVRRHIVLVFWSRHADKNKQTSPSAAGNQRTMATVSQAHTNDTTWPFPFSPREWEHTPPAVQDHLQALHTQLQQIQHQLDTLQGRLDKTSKTSSKPPSSDSPFTKPTRRTTAGQRGARKGHPGSGVTLLEPTAVQHVYPAPCACGQGELTLGSGQL